MGHNRRWRSVNDAARYDADIVIVCPSCEHTVVIERRTFQKILAARRINESLQIACSRMLCHRCGHRGGIIEMTAAGDRRTLGLGEGEPLPPPGVPLCDWLNWTPSQRQMHMRRRR